MYKTVLAQLKDTFSYSTEAVDVLCAIFRTGFPESEPGPFVFPPQMVTEFLTSNWQSRLSTVVNTASAFLSSLHHGNNKQEEVEAALQKLLQWTLEALHRLNGRQTQFLDLSTCAQLTEMQPLTTTQSLRSTA